MCAVVTGFGDTAAPVNSSAPTTSAATTQAPAGLCTASPRNATPSQGSDETITVHTTRGAVAYLAVHYPTTTRSFAIVADSAGTAVITFPTNRSTPGVPVQVDVTTNSGQVCRTQFTPQ
ncbi:MAG: hypothetical protein ACRDS0_18685 [Pseudonocardiaceae bacterium]